METPNAKQRHRRCQFGLRKLLLWTAVVAVLLGVGTSLGEGVWQLACLILVISFLRVAFGPKVGALSVAAVVILWVALSCAVVMSHHRGPGVAEVAVNGTLFGAFVWLVMFGIVEGLVRVVNWVDKMLETKSDGRD